MADQPEVLLMREVRGYLTARLPDGQDSDEDLDRRLVQGRVTFHPQYRAPLVYPGELIVLPEPVPARVVDGHILYEAIVGEETVLQPVRLPVTVDDRANQAWSWRLVFDSLRVGEYGDELPEWPEMRFPIEPGTEPLDLSEVSGRWSGGGLITRGAPGPGLIDVTGEGREVTFHWDGGGARTLTLPELTGRDADGRLHSTPVGVEGIIGDMGDVVLTSTDVQVIMSYIDWQASELTRLATGTGLRRITSLLASGVTGTALISRTGPWVSLNLYGITPGGTGSALTPVFASPLPAGFRPDFSRSQPLTVTGAPPADFSPRVFLGSDGACSVNRPGQALYGVLTYQTRDSWPTTLPGTPA